MAEKKREQKQPKGASDTRLYLGLAALVVLLTIVVWASIPSDAPRSTATPDGDAEAATEAAASRSLLTKVRTMAARTEFAILTNKDEATVARIVKPENIVTLLDVRHCGATCEAVRKTVLDDTRFETDVLAKDEFILPSKDTLDTVAPGLTPEERPKAVERSTIVVVRTTGAFTADQLPARTAFAAATALAEALDGYVFDEISRRIETKKDFATHAITVPLGQPVFAPRQIVVQLYRQDDGTARLLTLGNVRYGVPDLSARGASMATAPRIAHVLNAMTYLFAAGKTELPVTVSIEDLARATGKKPAELAIDPSKSKSVRFDLAEPEHIEGDPDNEMLELIPPGGADAGGWNEALGALFGDGPRVLRPERDQELQEIATKARKSLGGAIQRFQKGDGQLFVKHSFTVPADQRADGGPSAEALWVQAASCDDRACAGTISNSPEFATNFALGKTSVVPRADVLDWLLRQKDGTTSGGDSIKALEAK